MSVPTGLISHTRKVQTLYKKALRSLEDYYDTREVYRYYAILMRQRFDENRNVRDMRLAKELVDRGEEEWFKTKHWQQRKFPESPGGVAFERVVPTPDWALDYWHPLEKAQYPEYFARREQRKREYVKFWEKKFGKTESTPH